MDANFKVIISKNCQFLLSPMGEKVPNLVETTVKQHLREIANVEFLANVNFKSFMPVMIYDPETGALKMPGGEVLPVEILSYSSETRRNVATVRARCSAEFPYDTNHKETPAEIA